MAERPNEAPAPRVAPRRESGLDREARPVRAILKATEELLETATLQEISVGQILEHAGVARGSFYFYFDSKYAVVARLLGDVLAEIEQLTASVFEDVEGHPRDAVRARLMEIALAYRRHAPAMRAAAENWHASAEIREIYQRTSSSISGVLAAAIDEQQRGGELATEDARGIAAALMWMNERCLYVAAIGQEPAFPTDEALVDVLTEVWVRTVFAPDAG